ncbi:MAG: ABC-F family ATP-binding cassette domain-containing protein [Anaerolineae bacterium]|nr:ABC-F family ATP-binding cassette domain-containing protein [Anaerolineae bacterium]
MLHVTKLCKSYGLETVLADVSFVVNFGERVGLVGPNGCGKTTLLRLIAGQEQADGGSVRFDPPELEVGYLAQALIFEAGETVNAALARATAGHSQAWADMQHYAGLMAKPASATQLDALTTAYAGAEARFEAAGGYTLEARREAILTGLGLAEVPRDLPVEKLSGGQKTRLGLAGLLTRRPCLLLLDEPTNHLDLDALAWLEEWLRNYDGAVLLVSHDRAFLDAATTRTLVIDPATHTLRDFAGNYTAYTETLTREIERQWQAYQDQQDEVFRLQNAARRLRGQAKMKRGGKGDSGDKFAKGFFSDQSTRTVARAKQIERRVERLLTEERVDKPSRRWQLKVDFADDAGGARQVLRLENLAMAFGERALFSRVNLILTHGQRAALVGPNGEGKTTLLRLIAGELAPTAGQVQLGAGVKLGYMAQEQEILEPDLTPYDTIRAEAVKMDQTEIRRFLHFFLFSGDDVFVRVGDLSFGERARLMLALLVAQGCNFLLLDEPVNHLDIPSRERFEEALAQFPGTMLAVAHDRAFIRRATTGIWELRDGQIRARF